MDPMLLPSRDPRVRIVPQSRLSRLLPLLWAAPCSAVGLALATPLLLLGARARPRAGTLEVCWRADDAACGPVARRLPFCAVTLGHVIVGVTAQALDRSRAHERVHVRQYERWGLFFFPAYAASSLWQWLRGRRPYWDNAFEIEARLRGHDPCCTLRTMPFHRGRLVDHVHLRVADLAASKRFYRAVLEAIGRGDAIDEAQDHFAADELWIDRAEGPVSRVHLAFQADGPQAVQAFHAAALAAGGRDNGAPGERSYHRGYYAAFALDPDGNNVEAVFHGPMTKSADSVIVTPAA